VFLLHFKVVSSLNTTEQNGCTTVGFRRSAQQAPRAQRGPLQAVLGIALTSGYRVFLHSVLDPDDIVH
jgi:hypothetical protein